MSTRYLVLEGSAAAASCALLEGEKVLGEFFVNIPQPHSQTLLPMVENLLDTCGVPLTGLDFLAVTRGPGSFTGLRIAMAAVKGMAMAAGKPCVGVSTLEALARALAGFEGSAAAVMDARCGQVYAGLFALAGGRVERAPQGEDEAVSIRELGLRITKLKKPVFLVGDGAELCYNRLLEDPPPGEPPRDWLRLAPPHLRYQRAAAAGAAALEAWQRGDTLDAGELVPTYLRLPQAERELKKKQDQPTERSPRHESCHLL